MSNVAHVMKRICDTVESTPGLVVTDPTGHPLSEAMKVRLGEKNSGFGIMDTKAERTEPGSWWRLRRPRTVHPVIAAVTCRGDTVLVSICDEFKARFGWLFVYDAAAKESLRHVKALKVRWRRSPAK